MLPNTPPTLNDRNSSTVCQMRRKVAAPLGNAAGYGAQLYLDVDFTKIKRFNFIAILCFYIMCNLTSQWLKWLRVKRRGGLCVCVGGDTQQQWTAACSARKLPFSILVYLFLLNLSYFYCDFTRHWCYP